MVYLEICETCQSRLLDAEVLGIREGSHNCNVNLKRQISCLELKKSLVCSFTTVIMFR